MGNGSPPCHQSGLGRGSPRCFVIWGQQGRWTSGRSRPLCWLTHPMANAEADESKTGGIWHPVSPTGIGNRHPPCSFSLSSPPSKPVADHGFKRHGMWNWRQLQGCSCGENTRWWWWWWWCLRSKGTPCLLCSSPSERGPRGVFRSGNWAQSRPGTWSTFGSSAPATKDPPSWPHWRAGEGLKSGYILPQNPAKRGNGGSIGEKGIWLLGWAMQDTATLTWASANSQYCRLMGLRVRTHAYVLLKASSQTQSGKHCCQSFERWREETGFYTINMLLMVLVNSGCDSTVRKMWINSYCLTVKSHWGVQFSWIQVATQAEEQKPTAVLVKCL